MNITDRIRLALARFCGRFCYVGDGGGIQCGCRPCDTGYTILHIWRKK